MGVGSAKRAAAKPDRTPVKTRRSASKAIKSEDSPTATPHSSGRKKSSGHESGFSSSLPTDQQRRSNGRVVGRSLIVWGRPRMAEKVLLHLQYECARHKVHIPWDAIAHRLHPGSSGAAVMQHLNRLRRELIAEGHLVPPIPSRPAVGESSDPEVRGYVRQDMSSLDKETTRPVRFDEPMDDRKFSLPDAYVEDGEQTDCDVSILDRSDDEANAPVDDSPTPIKRSFRQMNAGLQMPARTEADNGSIYPVPSDITGLGDERIPIDEALLGSDANMYTSPPARRDRDHGDEGGFGAGTRLFDPGLYPPFPPVHPAPMGAERHHPTYAYGDPFEASGANARPEGGLPGIKHPFELYPRVPYGFGPWSFGYPIPPPLYPVQGQERQGDKPEDAAPGGSSTAETKVEPSRAETLSSSETQSTEPQMGDLINEDAGEIIDTIDPTKTIRA